MEDWYDVDPAPEQQTKILNSIDYESLIKNMLNQNQVLNAVRLTVSVMDVYKKYKLSNKFVFAKQLLLLLNGENLDNEGKILILVNLMDIFGYPSDFLRLDLRDFLNVLMDTNPSLFKMNRFTKMIENMKK